MPPPAPPTPGGEPPRPAAAEPPRPAAEPPQAPDGREPEAKPGAPGRVADPFSVEEIEAEFARLLGRPFERNDKDDKG
jgi:hypothetical protein